MDQLERRGVVLSNGLVLDAFGSEHFTIIGEVRCLGDICITVRKILKIVDGEGSNTRVQTIEYSYNARLEGVGNIFRYDSPHGEDHNPFHHKHRYDVRNGDKDGTVEKILDDEWPTLGAVIEEVEQWFYANYDWLERRD